MLPQVIVILRSPAQGHNMASARFCCNPHGNLVFRDSEFGNSQINKAILLQHMPVIRHIMAHCQGSMQANFINQNTAQCFEVHLLPEKSSFSKFVEHKYGYKQNLDSILFSGSVTINNH
ncbi:hypothetical protein Neut_0704 [Nitrosomonas eutropha C91]|uniref:Uncharacterized protein n=1 Tax=Nitrosomonas eutropha (strain DSM 101675 / C91 / Nm57) TaxID=335283 RepID=Q0AI56_NITEC|nr:hypothetical protein Neut_0704 [Nitrosomonas eutropha C91]